jgi:hypothetical protein
MEQPWQARHGLTTCGRHACCRARSRVCSQIALRALRRRNRCIIISVVSVSKVLCRPPPVAMHMMYFLYTMYRPPARPTARPTQTHLMRTPCIRSRISIAATAAVHLVLIRRSAAQPKPINYRW